MNENNRIDIYTIPPNFAEEGTILSGRVKTRNAFETALILAGLVPLIMSLSVTGKRKLYIGMIVLVPVIILAILGVQGESLFAFIASFFKFLKRRRSLSVPDERYRLEQSRKKERSERGGKIKRERGKKHRKPKKSLEAGTPESQKETDTGAKKKKTKAKWRKCSPKTEEGESHSSEAGGVL